MPRLTLIESARLIGVHTDTVRRWVEAGYLPPPWRLSGTGEPMGWDANHRFLRLIRSRLRLLASPIEPWDSWVENQRRAMDVLRASGVARVSSDDPMIEHVAWAKENRLEAPESTPVGDVLVIDAPATSRT